jgi:lipoprotein signal peptidase
MQALDIPFKMLMVVAIVFATDQITKRLASRGSANGSSSVIGRLVRGPRATLGRRKRWLATALLSIWISLFCAVTLIVSRGRYFQHNAAQLALAVALGGAAGNIYDEIRLGAVTDFIDIGWWPVFNVGDAAITVGVIGSLWFLR